MNFRHLIKKYNIDIATFYKVISGHGHKIKLEQLQVIPQEWIDIIEKEFPVSPKTVLTKPGVVKSKPDEKKEKQIKKPKINSKEKTTNTKISYAYVKFVGPKSDHAYVKIVEDINQLSAEHLRRRDRTGYLVREDCSHILEEQIISVSIKDKKRELASIEATSFVGTFVNENGLHFVDWLSFNTTSYIKNLNSAVVQADTNALFNSITLSLSFRNELRINSSDDIIDEDKLSAKVRSIFYSALESVDPLPIKISALKKVLNEEQVKSKLHDTFDAELEKLNGENDLKQLNRFINKWLVLSPDLITFEKITNKAFVGLMFDRWLNNKIPLHFWGDKLVDAYISYSLNDNNDLKKIAHTYFDEDLLREIHSTLPKYFGSESKSIGLEEYKILKSLINNADIEGKVIYSDKLHQNLEPDLQFDLWLSGEPIGFDAQKAIGVFNTQPIEIQERIVESLSEEELLQILDEITEISKVENLEKIRTTYKKLVFKEFNIISFDIESNIETIYELAWNTHDKWIHYSTEKEVKNGLLDFKRLSEDENAIFVGHNIIEFDCPILEKREVNLDPEKLWDTLLVETLLSPELKNYALITNHNALDDAKLTFDLFFNQLMRVLSNPVLENYLTSVISTKQKELLKVLKSKISSRWTNEEYLNEEKKKFFRPSPEVAEFAVELENQIDKASFNLIVGHHSLKNNFFHLPYIQFVSLEDSHYDYKILNRKAISESENLSPWNKYALLNYLDYCESRNQNSHWGGLAVSLKLKVEKEHPDIYQLFKTEKKKQFTKGNCLFVTLDELTQIIDEFKGVFHVTLHLLHPDYIAISNKLLLKEIDDETLKNIYEDESFWLKFSGGQSYVEFSQKELEKLEINNAEYISNFWLEKYKYGKYKIWGNYNWEKLKDKLYIKKALKYELSKKQADLKPIHFVTLSTSYLNNIGLVRLNPETVYRSRYWSFQTAILQKAINKHSATVFFIQRQDEVEDIENYFKKIGYYIPDRKIPISRRLELLHTPRKGGKIIIECVANIERVIQANYIGKLNIVVDSLNLQNAYYCAQDTVFFKSKSKSHFGISPQENEEEIGQPDQEAEDSIDTVKKTEIRPLVKDTFFLLQLQLPYINHLRETIHTADKNHTIWFLDPHLNDYPKIRKEWKATNEAIILWENQEDYIKDVAVADNIIHSVRPITDIPFDKEEIKVILAKLFLKKGQKWKKNQIPYLDIIIPGDKDVLVTLPTGGGKSLLFQGPALFKSSFTNRLTIVVTPLKALMLDQVEQLWEKGFYNNVEYINSDRATDVQVIYRAMAGGEISLMYVTPERFRSRAFLNALSMRMDYDGGLEYIVFDEAHCLSQWGHEFRPDYFNCAKRIKNMKKNKSNNLPLLLVSATVSEKIYNDFNLIFS